MELSYVKWIPLVLKSQCTGCGKCVQVCDTGSLAMRRGFAEVMRPDICCSDGHCAAVCPEDAMRMGWVEMDADRTVGKWGSAGRAWPGRVRSGRGHLRS